MVSDSRMPGHDRQMLPEDHPTFTPIALRKQLLASGYNEKTLTQAVRRGDLVRVRRGAFVNAHEWAELDAAQRYAARCRAAYLQAKTDVVLSHTSALPFLEAPLWGQDRAEIHLTRPDERAGRREAGVRQHCGKLIDGDVISMNGFEITSPTRAALEVTTLASTESALVIVTDLVHRGLTSVEKLRLRYESTMERWPHSLATDLVLRLVDPRIESVGEARTAYVLWRQHLPKPVPQFEVRDTTGRVVGRLDFAFPDHGAWIEFDGKGKYDEFRREGEEAVDVLFREKRRQDEITEITGWRCMRITWADLADPQRLAARIRRFLASARAAWVRTAS